MGRFNGTDTIVDIAGSAGSTALLATGPVILVEGEESVLTAAGAANTLQGFQYQLVNPDGTVGPWIAVPTPTAESGFAGDAQMRIGDRMSGSSHYGSILGNGPSAIIGIGPTPATVLCNLRSLTAGATSVHIKQSY